MNIINTTQHLLTQLPDYLVVGGLLKATPAEENGARYLYFEASNEEVDHQNEIILAKALSDSAEYYLRHGNVDLSHYSILGAKSGLANFMEYEIGKPIDVQLNNTKTFVKVQLYTGESAMAKNANMVWDSLTRQQPPSRWYPSVGGVVLSKSVRIEPSTGEKIAVVDKVRWNNIALDRCPVNKTVPEVSAAPVGVFAKSLNGFVIKALTADAQGADVANLTGGAALRIASLYGKPYAYYRNLLAKQLRTQTLSPHHITQYAQHQFGFTTSEAQAFQNQFLTDLNRA
jgi:hypothetical protein